MQRIAVAADDVSGLLHFLFEGRVIRCQLIRAVRALNEEKTVSFIGVKTPDRFSGQNDPERIANLANLELDHVNPPSRYNNCINIEVGRARAKVCSGSSERTTK